MRRQISWLVAVAATVSTATAQMPTAVNTGLPGADEKRARLIPRAVLFDNPDRAGVQISHDGRWLSYLAPDDGVMNVWVAPANDIESARVVTQDRGRGVRIYFWAHTNEHVVYLQDEGGDENWRAYSVNVESGERTDLTPFEGVQAQIQGVSHLRPGEILIGLNDRDPQLHDLYAINIETGERTLVQQNPGMVERGLISGFITTQQYEPILATRMNMDDGSISVLKPSGDSWTSFIEIPADDTLTTGPAGLTADNRTLWMRDSRDRNTGAVYRVDLETGERELVFEDPKADAAGLMLHPTTGELQLASFEYDRERWLAVDLKAMQDLQKIQKAAGGGEVNLTSRTLDDSIWIAAVVTDAGPVRYYRFDRAKGDAEFLFTNRTALDRYKLASMRPIIIPSRDGMELVSYLTLPVDAVDEGAQTPRDPLPMVLLVHGGPWARDSWGFNSMHQLLANRGYAVLSVNFRGSTGFGKKFVNAGDKEWAGKMHDDLIDAVDWAIEQGIAQPDKVAIMGGSYGGYATLVGLTFTPEKFAAGVDIVGPSNLVTLLESIPPYWRPLKEMFNRRVGDIDSEEGRKLLMERSPIRLAHKIQRPLLIAQGANDPRVKQAESDQIVEAMQKNGIPVTYALFPDEGHGFARPENSLAFFATAEAFLAEHLGGRVQSLSPSDFADSSLQIVTGVEGVPGLKTALESE